MGRPHHHGDRSQRTETDRGVSEVVAFVLVFAIIIGSVGVLYMTGFQSMTSYQEGEQLRNAERAMSALTENFNDIQRNGAIEERSGELALRDGRVGVSANGTTLGISIDGTEVENVSTGTITYQRGSSIIASEGGGVFRGVDGEPTQSVVLDQPKITCNEDGGTALISLLVIDSDVEERSIAGSDGVELSAIQSDTHSKTYSVGSGDDVNISVSDSEYTNGWEQVLDRNGWSDGECDVSRVTVRIVTVDVEL